MRPGSEWSLWLFCRNKGHQYLYSDCLYIFPITLLVKSSALALPAHWYLCSIALVVCFVLVLWTTTVNSGISSFLEDALGAPEILQRY